MAHEVKDEQGNTIREGDRVVTQIRAGSGKASYVTVPI
jgi:hypothetical protein